MVVSLKGDINDYAIGMGAGARIYIPGFVKIGSGVQKLFGGIYIQTHRLQDDLISLILFFQNKESNLKRTFWKN
jgi:hypothetical protein